MIYLLSSSFYDGVENLPMIKFLPTADSIDFLSCDILLFTSKNAVAVTNEIDKKWKELPAIAIGSQTAKTIKEFGGIVVGVGESFYASDLAQIILERFADKKILYLRPKEIASNALPLLRKQGINIKEKVIYETRCKVYDKKEKPISGSIIIVTSPLTVKCFVENFGSFNGYQVVAIGDTTAAALPVGTDFIIASKPLISECIKLAKEI